MKKLFLILLTCPCIGTLMAAPRSQEQAAATARRFFQDKSIVMKRASAEVRLIATSADLSGSPVKRSTAEHPAFYIYNNGEQGFVIVSGDDKMKDILAYSEEHPFLMADTLPDNLRGWLASYEALYERTAAADVTAEVAPRALTRGAFPTSVEPLLGDISYDQDTPYNNACPKYGRNRCMTGCVATALAQIMRYWEYPEYGSGSYSYTSTSYKRSCSFDFENHLFDWSLIPRNYTRTESAEELEALSQLLFGVGVAVNMDFGPYASSANINNALIGMTKYLNYAAATHIADRDYYNSTEWMDLIRTELSENRPIYYIGTSATGSHAFVMDGYDEDDMVHINWGWSGEYDGYFEVLTLDSEGAGIGGASDSSYQYGQAMLAGLQPENTTVPSSHFGLQYIEMDRTTLAQGETGQVTIRHMYNKSTEFYGFIAVLMEKDGKQTVITNKTASLAHNYGYSTLKMDVKIPTSLEDGLYDFYIATKASGEESWSKVRGVDTYTGSYTVEIKDGVCTFVSTGFPLSNLNCTTSYDLSQFYSSGNLSLDCTLENLDATHEFFGEISILLTDPNNEASALEIPVKQVLLAPGEQTTEHITGSISLPAGEYLLEVSWHAGYDYLTLKSETVTLPADPTSIREVSGNALHAVMENGLLCIYSPVSVKNVTVYTLSGTNLGSFTPETTGGRHVVPVQPGRNGICLLRLLTEDGQVHTLKALMR